MSADDATRQAARECPELRQTLVAAANTPSATAQQTTPAAVQEFNRAVAAKVETGMSRPQATRAVVIEQPDLQRAYLAACNSR